MPKIAYRYDVMEAGEGVDFLETGSVSKADYARAEVEKAFAKYPNAVHAEVFKCEWDHIQKEWDEELIASYKPGLAIPDTDFDKALAAAETINGPDNTNGSGSTIVFSFAGKRNLKAFGVTQSRINKIAAAGWYYSNGWKKA